MNPLLSPIFDSLLSHINGTGYVLEIPDPDTILIINEENRNFVVMVTASNGSVWVRVLGEKSGDALPIESPEDVIEFIRIESMGI